MTDGEEAARQATLRVADDLDEIEREFNLIEFPVTSPETQRRLLTVAWLRGASWGVAYGIDQGAASAALAIADAFSEHVKEQEP